MTVATRTSNPKPPPSASEVRLSRNLNGCLVRESDAHVGAAVDGFTGQQLDGDSRGTPSPEGDRGLCLAFKVPMKRLLQIDPVQSSGRLFGADQRNG